MRLVTYHSEDVASDGNVGSMTNTAFTGTIKSYISPMASEVEGFNALLCIKVFRNLLIAFIIA